MACANLASNYFEHPLVGSFAMKDNMLFGCFVPEGKLIIEGGGVDDSLGELREEEIVWGEVEMHHQYKDVSNAGEQSNGKVGRKINHGDHRVIRHRSMLSRQMEMQANTWTASNTMSAVLVAKQSTKGGACIKAVVDRKDQEVEVGGCEEEGGLQQHMDELIPPHELLARQYAATATTSSVLHGAGRTLKGMDLRRLRNEVWRQTGFVD